MVVALHQRCLLEPVCNYVLRIQIAYDRAWMDNDGCKIRQTLQQVELNTLDLLLIDRRIESIPRTTTKGGATVAIRRGQLEITGRQRPECT